jgi:hypothetical protein
MTPPLDSPVDFLHATFLGKSDAEDNVEKEERYVS